MRVKGTILINSIFDRKVGIAPRIIECRSVQELYLKVLSYVKIKGCPTYHQCAAMVRKRGYVSLTSKIRDNKMIYFITENQQEDEKNYYHRG